jgi:hypothetical protein
MRAAHDNGDLKALYHKKDQIIAMSSSNLKGYGLQWRKSRRSAGNGECVEVARDEGIVAVRDSKNPDSVMLHYSPGAWQSFLTSTKADKYCSS